MKVRCVTHVPSAEQLRDYGFDSRYQHRFDVTKGKEYTVLGLTTMVESPALGAGVHLDIIDDFDRWALSPLLLFEVVDPRPSRHWIARKVGSEAGLALWPESFFQEAYHDRLTDGVPEIVADFRRVRHLLENEFTS